MKTQGRYWAIEIYPDSCIEKYDEYLKINGYKCAISPLHDKDVNEDGTLKKPHYHIEFIFNGSRKKETVINICEELHANLYAKCLEDCQAYYEYLIHKNNPEKYQYNESDIVHINSVRADFMKEDYIRILEYIDDYKIKTLVTLTRQLRIDNEKRLLKYVSNNTYYINSYLKSVKDDYDGKIKTLVANLYNNYRDVYVDREVFKKLLNVFEEVKITE